MTDRNELAALADRLASWAGFISSGYECPAAGQVMLEAAQMLREMADENARLREALAALSPPPFDHVEE